MSLFPIFLKLTGRRCVVVGAGHLAESKIASLRAADAAVTVIAPQASASIAEQAAAGELTLHTRPYRQGDLAGAFLVVAATNAPAVNRAVFAEATATGVLCNAVDDPENCDFYYPAVVNRGDLQIAISTGGRSPALAQRLRQELEEQFGSEYESWVAELGKAREELTAQVLDIEARKKLLHEIASREAFINRNSPQRGEN